MTRSTLSGVFLATLFANLPSVAADEPAPKAAAAKLGLDEIVAGLEKSEKAWLSQKSWMLRYRHTRTQMNAPYLRDAGKGNYPNPEVTNARKGNWLYIGEVERYLTKDDEVAPPDQVNRNMYIWRDGYCIFRQGGTVVLRDDPTFNLWGFHYYLVNTGLSVWRDALPDRKVTGHPIGPEEAAEHALHELPRLLRDNKDKYAVRPVLERVDGYPCHVVERKGKDVLWIDAEHGCALRRRAVYHPSGSLHYELKADLLAERAPGLWLPEVQTLAVYNLDTVEPAELRGKLWRVVTNTLLDARFNDLPDDFFTVPDKDVKVFDKRAKKADK
jgi:hypothetical protein